MHFEENAYLHHVGGYAPDAIDHWCIYEKEIYLNITNEYIKKKADNKKSNI